MREKIITVSFAVSNSASRRVFQRMPLISAMTNTTKEPTAPASVGVAQPEYMELKIMMMTNAMGRVPGTERMRSPQVNPVMGRPSSGFNFARTMMMAAYTSAETTPGTKPAINSLPTDSSTMMA